MDYVSDRDVLKGKGVQWEPKALYSHIHTSLHVIKKTLKKNILSAHQ